MAPPVCRLFVLSATEKPAAVILRRGPTRWVQLITWNWEKDIFVPGQWFHGGMHEDRCDPETKQIADFNDHQPQGVLAPAKACPW